MLRTSNFKPAWWLANGHMQTIAPLVLRQRLQVSTVHEILSFPDGDFTELAWSALPDRNTTAPIVVILHGLAGSKDSAYIKGVLQIIRKEGWTGVLMHFRGCGSKQNNRPAAYHSGETGDLRFLLSSLQQRFPAAPLSAVGFSLGGNVLVKYLGEEGVSSPLVAGISVSAPLDLADCSKRINNGFSKIYQQYLLHPLKQGVKVKLSRFANEMPLDKHQLQQIKTMWQFDHEVTAPLFGFKSAESYYKLSSGKWFLKQIKTPCLLIHAADDPFMTAACIPDPGELSKFVTFELSQKGGHIGFITGNKYQQPVFWCEQRISVYLKRYLG